MSWEGGALDPHVSVATRGVRYVRIKSLHNRYFKTYAEYAVKRQKTGARGAFELRSRSSSEGSSGWLLVWIWLRLFVCQIVEREEARVRDGQLLLHSPVPRVRFLSALLCTHSRRRRAHELEPWQPKPRKLAASIALDGCRLPRLSVAACADILSITQLPESH